MDLQIKIDEQENRFFLFVNGKECVINYRPVNTSTFDYYRTFVPSELRGQGLAAKLTLFALEYAKKNNKKVIPSCSYIRSYIDEHPEWIALVAR